MEYRPVVDIARLMAAASIVCFHCPGAPYKSLTISGLAYFVLLTFTLQAISDARGNSFALKKRAMRLLVPWLIWCVFYALANAMRHRPVLTDLRQDPGQLLIGTELHLWFLPFAFFGSIVGVALLRTVSRFSGAGAFILLCLLSATLLAVVPLASGSLTSPFDQWMYAVPLLPIGLCIGLAQHCSTHGLAWRSFTVLALAIFGSWLCAEPSYLVAVLILSAAILVKSRDHVKLRWFASLSMGIYLLHPFVFLVIYKFLPNAPWHVFASGSFVGSAAASAAIMSIPRLGGSVFGIVGRPNRAVQRTALAPTA